MEDTTNELYYCSTLKKSWSKHLNGVEDTTYVLYYCSTLKERWSKYLPSLQASSGPNAFDNLARQVGEDGSKDVLKLFFSN